MEGGLVAGGRGRDKRDDRKSLKGPKHEIFESGFFTQIRRLWLGDMETGEKK